MKPAAWILFFGVQLLACVAFTGKLVVFCHRMGIDASNSAVSPEFAGQLSDLALAFLALVLVMVFVAMLDFMREPRQVAAEDDPNQTTVRVQTPPGQHKVLTKVVVTNDPRPAKDGSSEFELTLD